LGVKENLELMKTLDDAWNSQDCETFKKRHSENTAARAVKVILSEGLGKMFYRE